MINGMKSYQETNYQKLLDAIGPSVILTDAELKSLMWLAGRETQTVENVVSIFEKTSRSNNEFVKNNLLDD